MQAEHARQDELGPGGSDRPSSPDDSAVPIDVAGPQSTDAVKMVLNLLQSGDVAEIEMSYGDVVLTVRGRASGKASPATGA
jgi:hypothetical protein